MGRPVEHPEQRASDAEREAVVQVLARGVADGLLTLDEFAEQSGQAYEARTRGELVLALGDLPVANPLAPLPPPAPMLATPPADPGAPLPKRKWMVAIMGSEERRGRWRANRRMGAVSVMGGVVIDLRDAILEGPEVEITAWAIMGGVDVIVPEGIAVEDSGFMLMGGRTKRVKDVETRPGAPVVHVKAYGMWGGVTIKSKPSRELPAGDTDVPEVRAVSAAPPPLPADFTGGLVTVVCTDIVGSTRLADELGDQGWRRVLEAHNALVRTQLAAHGGREVKQLGDGFLAAFTSARRAVLFSVALQEALVEHRAGRGDANVEVRVGIHAGEVERDGNDVVGRNVHVASRLCDAAAPNEVLVSSVVVDLADSASDVRFADGRELTLPGLNRPVRAHPVAW